jgi:hypothetical protein
VRSIKQHLHYLGGCLAQLPQALGCAIPHVRIAVAQGSHQGFDCLGGCLAQLPQALGRSIPHVRIVITQAVAKYRD